MSCGICGGDLMLLGTLGNRVHSRCRSCGMDYNEEAEREEKENEFQAETAE